MIRTFILVHAAARAGARRYADEAPDGTVVEFRAATKSRIQEEKYHAMINDIATQCEFMGCKRDRETWKRLLVDAFARIKAAEGEPLRGYGEIMPSLDGSGFVQLGIQTRRFRKREASEFVEYLYAFGVERDVAWSEPAWIQDGVSA